MPADSPGARDGLVELTVDVGEVYQGVGMALLLANDFTKGPAMPTSLRRCAPLTLCTVALAASAVGCSKAGGGSGASDATAASASPRQTQSTAVGAATSAPAAAGGGGGDFCALTGNQLDLAMGWKDEKVPAADYLVALDRSAANAPGAIKSQVVYVVSATKKGVQQLEQLPVTSDTIDADFATLKANAQTWKEWTVSNCSADIAAKWQPETWSEPAPSPS